MNDGNLLEIKNLQVQYVTEGETAAAVNGVSFSLPRGKVLGLVGETGAGKTTTALSILKLLPKFTGKVCGGQILFDGKDILEASEAQMQKIRGNRISMIFQDPMTSLNPVLTVKDQIAEVLQLHRQDLRGDELDREIGRLLELVGIAASRMNDFPHQFSGGMKQRVVIAIAIACNPELLIADEPTTALDVTIQAQVLNMMRQLRKELNSSMILITHDLGVVASICDLIGIMYAGEIIEYGTLEDVFDPNRKHHPYTVGLFRSIPDISVKSERLSPIAGLMPDPTALPDGCKFGPRCPHCTEGCKKGQIPVAQKGEHKIKCILYGSDEI